MKAQWYGIQLWCQGQGFKTHILLFLDGGVDSLHLRVDEVRLDVVLHKNWKSKHWIEKKGSRSYHVEMIAYDPLKKYFYYELHYTANYAFSLGALNNETIINQ